MDQESESVASRGHQVERFERFNDDIDGRSAAKKVLLPAQVLWSDESRRSLQRVLRAYKPDVAHIHNTFPLLSPSVLYACRSEHVPVVATIHHYRLVCVNGTLFRDGSVCHDCVSRVPWPGVAHGCYRDSVLASLPVAAGMVAHRRAWRTMVSAYVFLSGAQRDVLATDGLPADRLFVKPNFVFPVAQAGASDGHVVYAGRLAPVKGLDLLMSAWEKYQSGRPSGGLRLAVAGAGPLEARVAAWSRSQASVDWRGMLSRDECGALVASARAVIVPSQWEETFGLTVVEGMAAGVPSVAPAHGSFPELITDGFDGTLFPPGDVNALAGVLADIDADPHRYRSLGQAALRTFERRFTPELVVAQLLDIYRFAIENPAA